MDHVKIGSPFSAKIITQITEEGTLLVNIHISVSKRMETTMDRLTEQITRTVYRTASLKLKPKFAMCLYLPPCTIQTQFKEVLFHVTTCVFVHREVRPDNLECNKSHLTTTQKGMTYLRM